MSEQMICFFILGLAPLVSLVIALIAEIATKNKRHK